MFWRQEGVSPWHVMQAGEGVAPGPVTFTHLLACALSQGRGSPRAGTEQDWDRVRTQTEGSDLAWWLLGRRWSSRVGS